MNEKEKKPPIELRVAKLEKRILQLESALDQLARMADPNNFAKVPRYGEKIDTDRPKK